MKKLLAAMAFTIVMAVVSAMVAPPAQAFRCGVRLVNPGDTRYDVISKCGPPAWVDSWEEERGDRLHGSPYRYWQGGRDWGELRIPRRGIVYITVEEWVYNLGPSQFQRILRFENSRLVAIATGDYGY